MFEKFNQKLLLKYPLIWNTRVIPVLGAALIIHLLFYVAGYLSYLPLTHIADSAPFRMQSVTAFSVLVSIVMAILWLVFYLRNNPLKAHYGVSSNYLYAEFLILFFILFCGQSFFLTYQQGLYTKVRKAGTETDLLHEANRLNLFRHFVAFEDTGFPIDDCCDSVRRRLLPDSIRVPMEIEARSTDSVSHPAFDRYDPSKYELYPQSYRYYCGAYTSPETEPGTLNQFQVDSVAIAWMDRGEEDSVRNLLNEVVDLCRKYGGAVKFNTDQHVREIFHDSNNTVLSYIGTSENWLRYERSSNILIPLDEYANIGRVDDALGRLDECRSGFWDTEIYLALLYFAACAALLLFSFRMINLKVWFISLIGAGLWAVVIPVIAVSSSLEWEGVSGILLVMFIIFMGVSASAIRGNSGKRMGGVTLLWSTWMFPGMIPMAWTTLTSLLYVPCYQQEIDYDYSDFCEQSDLYYWLKAHDVDMMFLNLILLALFVRFVLIPLSRKWQANAEE